MYKKLHKVMSFAFRIGLMLPFSLVVMLVLVCMAPFAAVTLLAVEDDVDDYKDFWREWYIEIPRSWFEYCVLGH